MIGKITVIEVQRMLLRRKGIMCLRSVYTRLGPVEVWKLTGVQEETS